MNVLGSIYPQVSFRRRSLEKTQMDFKGYTKLSRNTSNLYPRQHFRFALCIHANPCMQLGQDIFRREPPTVLAIFDSMAIQPKPPMDATEDS